MKPANATFPNDPVIVADRLTKIYGRRTVVSNLSFTVEKGQTLGLLGPNGAGKSTTMRMMMGLNRPSAGQIKLFGRDLAIHTKELHSRIGVVFEKTNLFENLSGYQNLAIFCKLYNKPLTTIDPLLETMDLKAQAHDPVKIYSKGMRQRILILRALLHQPDLLFLDEPCSGLDPVSSRIIRDYLVALKAQGITILLTSHDMDEVDELCDWIGFINHGQLIVLSEIHALKSQYGSSRLRITYQGLPDQNQIFEETVEPTPENLQRIQSLYQQQRMVSVHSSEANLGEIFRKLSTVSPPG